MEPNVEKSALFRKGGRVINAPPGRPNTIVKLPERGRWGRWVDGILRRSHLEFDYSGDVRYYSPVRDATFSYWVRWAGGTKFGFLTVLHGMQGFDQGEAVGAFIYAPIATSPMLGMDCKVYFKAPTSGTAGGADVAVLEVDSDTVDSYGFLASGFSRPRLEPITPDELDARVNSPGRHYVSGANYSIDIDWFSDAGFPTPSFPFTGFSIPASDIVYPFMGIPGIVGAIGGREAFQVGRSGSAWVMNLRPLAIQVCGYPGSFTGPTGYFKYGLGQLVHYQLLELQADGRFPGIEIVDVT